METLLLKDPLTKVHMCIVGLEAKNYMKYHELNMKNYVYDTRCIYHNGKIVTRMDVKDALRLYCLTEQSQEESQIETITLKQFKGKIFPKHLLYLTDTYKIDAIYFDYHKLDKSHYKGAYTFTVITNAMKMIEKNAVSRCIHCSPLQQKYSSTVL